MKKLNKFIKILVFILLFCMISDVKAEEYSDANEVLKSVLNGSNSNAKGYFDGNYIHLCEYNYGSSSSYSSGGGGAYSEDLNLYYSLKTDSRGIYVVDAATYTGADRNGVTKKGILISVIKGGTNKILDKFIFKSADNVSGDDYFKINNETAIVKELMNGNCPNISTKGFKITLTSEETKNSVPTTTTNHIKDKVGDAYNNTIKDIGYADESYLTNNNTILGKYYQYEINKMKEKEQNGSEKNCDIISYEDDSYLLELINEAKQIYISNVKKKVFSSTTNKEVNKSLPMIITNCDKDGEGSSCIDKSSTNSFQKYLNIIIESFISAGTKAQQYCVNNSQEIKDVELNEKEYLDCLNNNTGTEYNCDSLKEEYDESYSEYKNLKEHAEDHAVNVNSYIYKNLIISSEAEKPKGCAIFGQKTTTLLKWAYKLIKIGAPILVVILGILDFVRALLAGDDKGFKEAWQRFIKRLIAAVVVILLPVLVTFLLDISGVLKQYGIEGEGNEIYCIFK